MSSIRKDNNGSLAAHTEHAMTVLSPTANGIIQTLALVDLLPNHQEVLRLMSSLSKHPSAKMISMFVSTKKRHLAKEPLDSQLKLRQRLFQPITSAIMNGTGVIWKHSMVSRQTKYWRSWMKILDNLKAFLATFNQSITSTDIPKLQIFLTFHPISRPKWKK